LFITFLPSFLKSLHYSTAVVGFVTFFNLIADNLTKGAAGWLIDRYGPWPILLTGSMMVLTGVLIIIYFHQSIPILILAAILIGLGVAPTWPGAIGGSIQTVGESKRATIISIISVVWLGGGGLGPVLMGFLIDNRMRQTMLKLNLPLISAYRTGFLILFAIAALSVIICILGFIGWHRVPHLRKLTEERQQIPIRHRLWAVFQRLWKVKGLVPGMFFQAFAMGLLLPNLLPYATTQLGLSEAQYSLLLLIGGAGAVLFMIPVGHFADHMGSRRFLVSGFTLAALALFILVTYGNRTNIWWLVGFVGLSYALIQPAWNALLAGAVPPEQRGVLMGLFMSVEGLGFAVGPAVGGLLGTIEKGAPGLLGRIGPATPFYVSGIFLLVMALVYLVHPFHHYRIEE
ncbi:MAG TPA: MFS transporter, partial [Bacillota bacterium]